MLPIPIFNKNLRNLKSRLYKCDKEIQIYIVHKYFISYKYSFHIFKFYSIPKSLKNNKTKGTKIYLTTTQCTKYCKAYEKVINLALKKYAQSLTPSAVHLNLFPCTQGCGNRKLSFYFSLFHIHL